jgi:signal peptidase II
MSAATAPGRWAIPLALLVVALDQGAKAWIVGLNLGLGAGPDMPGPLRVTLVENPGISYGLFQGGADWTRWLFTAFALAVTLALGVWARRAERLAVALGLGLIMGGALGNVADRVFRGAVVDFIDARALGFPWIFNLADSAITLGILLLLADSLMAPKRSAT